MVDKTEKTSKTARVDTGPPGRDAVLSVRWCIDPFAFFPGIGKVVSGVLCLLVCRAGAQEAAGGEYALDALIMQGADLVQTLQEEYEVDWEVAGELLTRALQSGEWQSLVDVDAAAEELYAVVRRMPGGAVYADWLRQRMDYLDVAEWVMQEDVPTRPTPRPTKVWPTPTPRLVSTPVARPTKIWPTPTVRPEPTATPVKQDALKRREKAAASVALWKKTLAKRSAPARAAELVPRLRAIFREEGLPEELIWMAEVESSMNPEAKSPVGAAGLFQFMPATAKQYGLQVSPRDERLDPEKSARAAATYLKALYKRFEDWPLSLAAYNAGEGRVGRVLRERKATTFEQIAEHLPLETRMYVPKILAVIELREKGASLPLPPPVVSLRGLEEGCGGVWLSAW